MGEKQKKKEVVWTSAFIRIVFVSLAMRMCTQMQNTILPLYVTNLGYNAFYAGLMTSVYTLTALVFRPMAGSLMDRKGRIPVLLIGTILFTVTAGLYALALPLALLLVVRSISGAGFCWNGTAISTMASDVLPDSRMSEGIGYLGLAQTISQAIAPGIALALKDCVGFQELFLTILGMSAAVLIICLSLRSSRQRAYEQAILARYKANADRRDKEEKWIYQLFEKNSWRPSLLMLFIAVANCTIGTFLAVAMEERGVGSVGLFFTISAVVMALIRLFAGKISARYGSGVILIPGFLLLAGSLIGIALAHSDAVLLVCALSYGIAMGALQPEINAIAVVSAKKESRGAANATFLMMMDIGNGIGSAVWGAIAGVTGFAMVFIFSAAVASMGLVLYFLFHKKKIV